MRSSTHTTIAAVVVVAGVTVDQSSPLHHCRRRLQPHHTVVCWSAPCPLPLTGRCTGRWSPRTLTPLHGVIREGRVSSTVGGGGAYPNQVAMDQGPSSSSHQGEDEGEEEDDECHMTVVSDPVEVPMIHRMACISIGPRGRPQELLVPRTTTDLANPIRASAATGASIS
jgi:hypothetical protein